MGTQVLKDIQDFKNVMHCLMNIAVITAITIIKDITATAEVKNVTDIRSVIAIVDIT
jgi:hypothetical protein